MASCRASPFGFAPLGEGETMARRTKRGAEMPRPDEESASQSEAVKAVSRTGARQGRAYPDPVDDTLYDSFPASDPPSWAGR